MSRFSFHPHGRTGQVILPDKEFRYLRTVIVTAAVYWGFDWKLLPLFERSIFSCVVWYVLFFSRVGWGHWVWQPLAPTVVAPSLHNFLTLRTIAFAMDGLAYAPPLRS